MPENPKTLRIKISGEAGYGILTSADILLHSAAFAGYYSSVFKSIPASVRSGSSEALITISEKTITSPVSSFDILFSLSADYQPPMTSIPVKPGSLLFFQSGSEENRDLSEYSGLYSVPFEMLASEIAPSFPVLKSIIALGIFSQIAGLPLEYLEKAAERHFSEEKKRHLENNIKALHTGAEWSKEHLEGIELFQTSVQPLKNRNRIILEGNQAISLGALAAGCRYYASYPITPSTAIGEYLTELLPESGGAVYQAEDEIAALGSVIGASFTGVKAMTATSGPGLSLMQEFIGYASMAEIPVVIVDVQRAGPSTGMPTKQSQDDLLAAAFGGHGEAPRIVIAPVNTEDCFHTTIKAFELSEKYRCPVIILGDSAQGMIKETIDNFNPGQHHTADGRTGPHSSGILKATGLEHDKEFFPSEVPRIRTEQVIKRFAKLDNIEAENGNLTDWDLEKESVYEADFALIAWGGTVPSAREAVDLLRKAGYTAAAMYPRLLFPLCRESVMHIARFSSNLFVPESNFTGQYSSLIRMNTGIDPISLPLFSGEPFTPEEIVKRVVKRISFQIQETTRDLKIPLNRPGF